MELGQRSNKECVAHEQ